MGNSSQSTRSPTATAVSAEAVERLVDASVLRPLTNRQRHQVWGAELILDELEDLSDRIASAMR